MKKVEEKENEKKNIKEMSNLAKIFNNKGVLIGIMSVCAIYILLFISMILQMYTVNYISVVESLIAFTVSLLVLFVFYKCLNKYGLTVKKRYCLFVIMSILFIFVYLFVLRNNLGDGHFNSDKSKYVIYSSINCVLFMLFIFMMIFNLSDKKYKKIKIVIICLFVFVSLFLPCQNNKLLFKLVNNDFKDYEIYVDFIDSYNSHFKTSYPYFVNYKSGLIKNRLKEKNKYGYYKSLYLNTKNYNEADFLKLYEYYTFPFKPNGYTVKKNDDGVGHFLGLVEISELNAKNFYCDATGEDSVYQEPKYRIKDSLIENFYILNNCNCNLNYFVRIKNLIFPYYKTNDYEMLSMLFMDSNSSLIGTIKLNNTTITYPIESAYLKNADDYLNIYLNDKKFDVLKVDNGTVEVYDENNVPVKEGKFKTGYIIRITTDNNQLFYLKVK